MAYQPLKVNQCQILFINIDRSISNNLYLRKSFVCTQFKSQTVLFDLSRTLSGATTLSQSGPGSNGIEGVLYIP